MKKNLIFLALITVFFISCTGFFDLRNEEEIKDIGKTDGSEPVTSTSVYFNNLYNIFPVDIFSAHTRQVKVYRGQGQPDLINQPLPPDFQSGPIYWLPTRPNEDFFFYLTFYLPVCTLPLVEFNPLEPFDPDKHYYHTRTCAEAASIRIPFIPLGYGLDYVSSSIPHGTSTEIKIHNLMNSTITDNTILMDDVFIIIENNFASSVSLLRGSILFQTENLGGFSLNSGQKGLYKISSAATSAGYIIRSTTDHNLPSDITSLEKGYVYIIEVQAGLGTLKFIDSFPLTLGRYR